MAIGGETNGYPPEPEDPMDGTVPGAVEASAAAAAAAAVWPDPRHDGWVPVRDLPPGVALPAGAEPWLGRGGLGAIRQHRGGRWRLSLSHPKRMPTLVEMEHARRAFLPHTGVWVALVFPPDGSRLRAYEGTVHLVEIQDPGLEGLVEDVRFESAKLGRRS